MNKSASLTFSLFFGAMLSACAPNATSGGSGQPSTAALGSAPASDPSAKVKVSTIGLASSGDPDDSITSSECIKDTEQPAAGIQVTFTGSNGLQGSAWTDDQGEVTITGPSGVYIVTVPGYTMYDAYTPNPPDTRYAVDLEAGNTTTTDDYLIIDSDLPCP